MFRHRYINSTPVVFTAESWAPELGDEAEFDHIIDHPFVQLVIAKEESPVVPDEAITAANGDDLKEN